MLTKYMQQTQRFLRDARQDYLNPDDLRDYINRSRREVAMRAQAIRTLTPISGSITGWSVTAPGAGYSTTPTFTISAPDFPSGKAPFPLGAQATATGIVQSGTISAIFSSFGGSGYFQPTMTITDSTGHGATATAVLTATNQLIAGQEEYPFSGINLALNPGCESVYAVRGISIIYSNYRYSLPVYAFSVYQALIRQYPYQYQYVPCVASQLGQGSSGSFYVYPLPSQVYQYELDCQCLPQDLLTDESVEALPMPWQDAVPFYCAHLAFAELQNFNASKYYLDLYEKMALRFSQYARIGRVVNPYGRY